MKKSQEKTNVMRILDQKKIPYQSHTYAGTGAISGREAAAILNQNPSQVFKTLVTYGATKTNYVFLIPVEKELNLKKAALSVNEKSITMHKSKDLLPLTGYIHGGFSPIGMKKPFQTTIDTTALTFPTILFSAGKIGFQVELTLTDLKKVLPFTLKDLT